MDKQCSPISDCLWRRHLISVFPVCYSDKHFANSSHDNPHFIWEQKDLVFKILKHLSHLNLAASPKFVILPVDDGSSSQLISSSSILLLVSSSCTLLLEQLGSGGLPNNLANTASSDMSLTFALDFLSSFSFFLLFFLNSRTSSSY